MDIDKNLWLHMKSRKPVSFLNNKSRKNSSEILYALAILGNATSTEISEFVVKKRTNSHVISKSNIRKYRGSIKNRFRNRTKSNLGLVDQGFILETGVAEIKNKPPIYALTMKGCFLALGLELTNKELIQFIRKSSKHYLFFAYLNSMINKISYSFTKTIFITSIRELIGKGLIPLDNDFQLCFSTISDFCGYNFYNLIQNFSKKDFKSIEDAYQISLSDKSDLFQDAVEKYFPNKIEKQNFIDIYQNKEDTKLYLKLQNSIVYAYDESIDV